MKRIYNALFTFFFCLSAPFYFLKMWRRGNWQQGFSQRFGRFSSAVKQSVTNRQVLWIHAVSVGEVNIATQLIRALELRLPNLKTVVSTTTSTGMGELQKKLPSHIQKIYYPVDRRTCVMRSVLSIHPDAIVLVEAEVWPNFLWYADERRIPRFLVNARLSKRSYRGYRLAGFLFRSIFAGFAGVGCQNEEDAKRLRALGCRPETIRVVGNMKFDAAKLEERRLLDVKHLLQQLGLPPNTRLLVAGSTHAGEESIIAEVFLRLRQRFPELFLVLVPRHFERGKEVGRELAARKVRFIYRSEVTANSHVKNRPLDCLLVNTTGELKYFYEHAAAVFVGKSLTAEGGQNPLEPGALGRPMVFGPNMQNFEAIARSLVDHKGARMIHDATELESALAEILADADLAAEMGANARKVIRENLGAVERTVEMIAEVLQPEQPGDAG
jgi:3-deoxy-D-manno-octulosonic-acid transferase